jgi:hypothetical protein
LYFNYLKREFFIGWFNQSKTHSKEMIQVEDNPVIKTKTITKNHISALKDIKSKVTSLVLNQLKKLFLDEPEEQDQITVNPLTPLRHLKSRPIKPKPVVNFSTRLSAKLALKTHKKQSLRRLALLRQKSQKLVKKK